MRLRAETSRDHISYATRMLSQLTEKFWKNEVSPLRHLCIIDERQHKGRQGSNKKPSLQSSKVCLFVNKATPFLL